MRLSYFIQQFAGYKKEMYVQLIFELRNEISLFIRIQNKQDLVSAWSADSFEIRLAYLVDIFRQLNTLTWNSKGKEA